MAKVAVRENGAAKIEKTPNGIKVTVRPKKRIFILFFIGFWLIFWTFGGVSAIEEFFKPGSQVEHRLFLGFWLCGWLAGELFAMLVIGWTLAGKETIELTSSALAHKREIFDKGISNEYETEHIKNIRISSGGAWGGIGGLDYWGIGGGTISFDYGGKTFKLGVNLEEAEANSLILEMQKYLGRNALVA